jgi:hypothetical protein
MREVGAAMPAGGWAGRGAESGTASSARLGLVRPRAVWEGLSPRVQARIRQTFVRVLLDALGVVPAPREAGRDAPHP